MESYREPTVHFHSIHQNASTLGTCLRLSKKNQRRCIDHRLIRHDPALASDPRNLLETHQPAHAPIQPGSQRDSTRRSEPLSLGILPLADTNEPQPPGASHGQNPGANAAERNTSSGRSRVTVVTVFSSSKSIWRIFALSRGPEYDLSEHRDRRTPPCPGTLRAQQQAATTPSFPLTPISANAIEIPILGVGAHGIKA